MQPTNPEAIADSHAWHAIVLSYATSKALLSVMAILIVVIWMLTLLRFVYFRHFWKPHPRLIHLRSSSSSWKFNFLKSNLNSSSSHAECKPQAEDAGAGPGSQETHAPNQPESVTQHPNHPNGVVDDHHHAISDGRDHHLPEVQEVHETHRLGSAGKHPTSGATVATGMMTSKWVPSKVWGVAHDDASCVVKEMFEGSEYFGPHTGMVVQDGDTIVDVGANIGMFSSLLASRFQNLRIVAFEPIPALSACATLNLNAMRDAGFVRPAETVTKTAAAAAAANQSATGSATVMRQPDSESDTTGRAPAQWQPSEVTLMPCGLSSSPSQASFLFMGLRSIGSSMFAEENLQGAESHRAERGLSGIRAYCRFAVAVLRENKLLKMYPTPVAAALSMLHRVPVIRALVPVACLPFLAYGVAMVHASSRQVTCQLDTFSRALADTSLRAGPINLLKVDVEGAEEEVLKGISEADWARIQQVIVEVHDINGRLGKITEMLTRRGFRTRLLPEEHRSEFLELMGIAILYATRLPSPSTQTGTRT